MFEKGDGPVRAAEREGDGDGRPPAPPRHGHRLRHRRHTLPLGTGWLSYTLNNRLRDSRNLVVFF